MFAFFQHDFQKLALCHPDFFFRLKKNSVEFQSMDDCMVVFLVVDFFLDSIGIWVFPKILVPQNGW